jgi:hypothetical protein
LIYTSAIIKFHGDVRHDFEVIESEAPNDYPHVLAFFEQLKADPHITEKLLDHGYGRGGSAEISAMRWLKQWNQGVDLWRLRSRDLELIGLRYRVIYLYLVREARFVIMAIVARDKFNYDDPNHPITVRIRASLKRSYGIG